MALTLLSARVILAATLLVAGVAKLVDRRGTRQVITEFGVPGSLAVPGSTLLPLVEIGIAAALLPEETAWAGAIAAAGLLLGFLAGIVANLARGRQPDCHCFGQFASAPVSWWTAARTGGLLLVAAFVVGAGADDPGPAAWGWASGLSGAEAAAIGLASAALALTLINGWFLFELLRQHGRLMLRLEALEGPSTKLKAGDPAPDFTLPNLHGETVSLEGLRTAGKSVALLFVDPDCGPCRAMFPDVARWQGLDGAMPKVIVVGEGEEDRLRTTASEFGLGEMLLQSDREVSEAFGVYGSPGAVLIDANGVLEADPVMGEVAIRTLVGADAIAT